MKQLAEVLPAKIPPSRSHLLAFLSHPRPTLDSPPTVSLGPETDFFDIFGSIGRTPLLYPGLISQPSLPSMHAWNGMIALARLAVLCMSCVLNTGHENSNSHTTCSNTSFP